MKDNNLAIVIPAYKADFFKQTLESIATQTCKDFVLYVGDDASPYHLQDIVAEFEARIEIRYQKFEKNLGGKDLIAQWERCIELSEQEKWIWLFSDDDLMDRSCVENFYRNIDETKESFDVYRFNTARIDHQNRIIIKAEEHPIVEKGFEFLKRKLKVEINSYAVEFIFCRSVYEKIGFVNFPAAWASDDATWALWGEEKGIRLIPGPIVYWRSSEFNISGSQNSKIARQKLKAVIQFINWEKIHFKDEIPEQIIIDWAFFHFYQLYGKNIIKLFKFTFTLISKTTLNKLNILYRIFYRIIKYCFSKIKQ